MKTACLLLVLLMNIFWSCGQIGNQRTGSIMSFGYDLSVPDRIYFLPRILQEISGITELDDASIACIQDEQATIFIHDINKNEIIRRLTVGDSGDYEGIARVDKTIFILRSDGLLSEITNFESGEFKKTDYSTGIPWKNNERICYDRNNNRLLIAPKETPGKDSGNKNLRFIYGFSLSSHKLINEPVFRFDLSLIKKFALENKIKVPMKGKKREKEKPDLELKITEIGIHPITGNLFALSGTERILYIFDMNGNIRYIKRLDSDLFRQPEGITFMNNGDMYISNEGKKKLPTLVRFKYKPA